MEHFAEIARKILPQPALSNTAAIAQFLSQQYGFSLDEDVPARARQWLRADEQALPTGEQLARLGVRLWHVNQSQDWQERMIQQIKASPLFSDLVKVVYQSHRFHHMIQMQQSGVHLERLSPEKMSEWFRQRWQVTEDDFAYAILDRGFTSRGNFWQAARFFYLFDKYIGVAPLAGLLAQKV
jgi:hypothetical protein